MKSNVSQQLFNSTIIASTIVCADELNLLEALAINEFINIQDFCKKKNIHEFPFRTILNALSVNKIIKINEDKITKSLNFTDVYKNKGYFTWLIKGYGFTLENMDILLKKKKLKVENLHRNAEFIAKAGKDYGNKFVDKPFLNYINKIKPHKIIDIGCGNAERLIKIVQNNKNIKAIGIEINSEVVKQTKQYIKEAKLNKNIEIICADIKTIKYNKIFEDADVLCSFFMGHDLFPAENVYKIFNNFKYLFPNVKNFLLCDTFKNNMNKITPPIFTMGFEITHALMGQKIPTYNEWMQLFKSLNWKSEFNIKINIPNSIIFNLKI